MPDAGQHVKDRVLGMAKGDEGEIGLQQETGALDCKTGGLLCVQERRQLTHRVIEDVQVFVLSGG